MIGRVNLKIILISIFILISQNYSTFAEDAPPVINLIRPANEIKVTYGTNAKVVVQATTTNNVQRMAIYLDNVEKIRVNSPSVSFILDCSGLSIGSHTIRITADNGKISEKSIALEMIYPNTIITLNSMNFLVEQGSSVNISATANDGGFTHLELAIDSIVKATVQKAGNVTKLGYVLQTTGMSIGEHQFTVMAKTGDGIITGQAYGKVNLVAAAQVQPLSIRISPPDPSTQVIRPGAFVRVAAAAFGGGEGIHMILYLDNIQQTESAGRSLVYIIDTGSLSIGKHAIRITARDNKNQTTELTTSLTVQRPVLMEKPIRRLQN
ncbi:MAG: hypothetical protein JW927_18680 [Deltaproteobacteria bacterium]|nr:hypothetical protein [Deltaproteobacteria bacterium]